MVKTLLASLLFTASILTASRAEDPTIEQILKSVEKQSAPDVKDLPEKQPSPESVIIDANSELNREIMRSKEPKLRIIYAITCLNFSITFLENSGAKNRPDQKDDYEKMIRFREILAKEYLRISK